MLRQKGYVTTSAAPLQKWFNSFDVMPTQRNHGSGTINGPVSDQGILNTSLKMVNVLSEHFLAAAAAVVVDPP